MILRPLLDHRTSLTSSTFVFLTNTQQRYPIHACSFDGMINSFFVYAKISLLVLFASLSLSHNRIG